VLVASVLGIYQSSGWYVFCLVDVIPQSRTMRNVVASVTRNAKKLLTTAVLAVFLLYVYASISYYATDFRDQFSFEDHMDCSSLGTCFQTFVSYGFLHPPIWNVADGETGGAVPLEALPFTLSYNVLINLIMTAVVSGIIIDSFSAMREHVDEVQRDQRDKCFVCGIERDEFEQHGLSFDKHTKEDHNMCVSRAPVAPAARRLSPAPHRRNRRVAPRRARIASLARPPTHHSRTTAPPLATRPHHRWDYLFFKLHLAQKDPTEYTGQEQHVHDMIAQQRWGSFFPIKKALAIQGLATTEKKDLHSMIRRVDDLQQSVARMERMITKLASNSSSSL